MVNDRGLAPNTPETYGSALPEIEGALKKVLGHAKFGMTKHDREKRQRFGVSVKSEQAFEIAAVAAS